MRIVEKVFNLIYYGNERTVGSTLVSNVEQDPENPDQDLVTISTGDTVEPGYRFKIPHGVIRSKQPVEIKVRTERFPLSKLLIGGGYQTCSAALRPFAASKYGKPLNPSEANMLPVNYFDSDDYPSFFKRFSL